MEENMRNESITLNEKVDVQQFAMKNYSQLEKQIKFIEYLELLLKKPGKLFYEMNVSPKIQSFIILSIFSAVLLLIYGVIVGSFSGGKQYLVSPSKIIIGMYTSAFICLPSLYIFACLSQAKIGFVSVMGNLLITLALIGVLLIGFLPVAWVFSQSTTSIPFIGFIHIAIFIISLLFAFRLLGQAIQTVSEQKSSFIVVWITIFILVSLQMSTSLRPIIGTSDQLFPTAKKFFLTHWSETMSGSISERK